MRQEFLILAEAAEAVNGKIYILGGGVDVHRAPSFPTSLKADIAVSFLTEWGETNRPMKLEVQVVDEDGGEVFRVEAGVTVGRPAHAMLGQDIRTLMAIRGPFTFQRPGAYKLTMLLSGVPQDPPFRFWLAQSPSPKTG